MTVAEFINKVGFKVKDDDVKKVNSTISGIKNTATRLLGALGVGLSLTAVNGLVEEFTCVNDQIRNATDALGDQKEIQEQIMAAAEATRTSYSDTANVVSMLVKGNSKLFADVNEAVKFNNAAAMLFKNAGKTNEDIASLMEAINKSFQKGYVDSETISQLLERAPEAVALLNKRFGTTSDKLEEMASSGAMSVADLKAAFLDSAEEIEAGFGNVQYRITDALTVIRSKWGLWLAQTNETLGITDSIGRRMVSAFNKVIGALNHARNGVVWLADKLGGVDNMFRLIAIAAGIAFAAFNFSKITAGLSSISKLLTGVKVKTLAIIAVILLVALLVDDFINFMKGNDSLLGTLFDKMGIGADNARQAIFNAFGKIRDFVMGIWNEVTSFLEEHNEEIQTMFSAIWGAITQILSVAFTLISTLAKVVFGALQAFWEKWGDKIKSVFLLLADFFGRAFERIISVIAQFAEFLSAIFAGDIQGALQSLLGIFQAILEEILDLVQTIFTAIWTFIGDKVIAIKGTIVEGFQAAIDWITSLPAQAVQWGADIIDGIVDGIKGAVGKVGEAVSGVADKIKSFLGFSKPDEGPLSDFDTYMPDMIDLMVKGIRAGKEKVKGALGNLAENMSVSVKATPEDTGDVDADDGGNKKPKPKPSPSSFLNGLSAGVEKARPIIGDAANKMAALANAGSVKPRTAAVTTSSSQISKSVVQNVEINNQFNGDKVIQQKASTAMDQSAKDVTSELARGLAYTR